MDKRVKFAAVWIFILIIPHCGQTTPVSSLGTFPLPRAVGTEGASCACGHVVATGVLEQHASDESYFAVGTFTVMVPPRSSAAMALRSFNGQAVEVVIRPVEHRELGRLER